MEYASKGMAGTALGFGIGGTVLGALAGGATALVNGRKTDGNCAAPTFVQCSENTVVSRYEMGLTQENADLKSQIALRDANLYGDQKLLEVYRYFDGELKDVRSELCKQAVHNQRTEDSFVLAQADLKAVKADLECKIRNEAEKRCCGDNAIVNYVNATFYPKMVADVTTGTETTAQNTFNPIPRCGHDCCNG